MKTDLHSLTNSTITRQIHRADRGASSWWHTATVCDLPGSYSAKDLLALITFLPLIRRMGFDGVLLRLSAADPDPQSAYISKLVTAAHAAALRVIVRVSPDDTTVGPLESPPLVELHDDAEALVNRTRILLNAGVDGVDLGLIDDDPHLPDPSERAARFTATVNRQLAELASVDATVILTAEASTANPQFFEHHVKEDWFHHLRDDSLFRSAWDARQLQERVRKTYAHRDPLGQTVAWRPARASGTGGTSGLRVSEPGTWADAASDQRINAFTTYVGSLPGALYLPFAYTGGQVNVAGGPDPSIRAGFAGDPGSRFQRDLTARMLNLRQQKGMARANCALIEQLTWAGPQVAVHLTGHTMVVLNASDEPVYVPDRHLPLLYSDGFVLSDGQSTVVQPDTCAWFDPAPAQTRDPGRPFT